MNVQSSRIQLLVFGFQPFVSRWIRPTSEGKVNSIVEQITDLQDMGGLQGVALDFAEGKGYGPLSVDSTGWTLLHHATVHSQHRRGMLEVIRGLLAAMPVEVVDQKTGGGMQGGWSALSLVCNGRDPYNERTDIARLLVAKGADVEVRNAYGATPLITACAVGFFSVVQVLLEAGADATATNARGRNAEDVTPGDQRKVFYELRKNHAVAK